MIWIAITLLAIAALAPLAVALGGTQSRGAQALAVDLHRTQLVELDRDLAEGRIAAPEHATARLEVQRRLLSAADAPETVAAPGARWPLLAAAALVPAAALGLYMVGGAPAMPSIAAGAGDAEQMRLMEEATLVGQLRERLQTLDPATDQARQGWILLGTVEEARGRAAEAVQAWGTALAAKFDPALAVRTAELVIRNQQGRLTQASTTLLERALATPPSPDAPGDAEWRNQARTLLRPGPR